MSEEQSKSQLTLRCNRKHIDAEGDRLICASSQKKEQQPRPEAKKSERRRATVDDAEILDIMLPFKSIGERSSLTNLNDLMNHCPRPQSPLTVGELKSLTLSRRLFFFPPSIAKPIYVSDEGNAAIMREQIRLMKSSMETLQEFVKEFCCTRSLRDDVDFIVANVRPALLKSEFVRNAKK